MLENIVILDIPKPKLTKSIVQNL